MSTLQTAADVKELPARALPCLQEACLAEMHAHRLYTAFAQQMEDAALYVIAHAFRYTAAQEKEHADILRGLLVACGESAVPAAQDAPLLFPQDTLELLHAVIQAEMHEGNQRYPRIAQAALAEGYPRVAEACHRIGEMERNHAQRFRRYAQALADGHLFRDALPVSWVCLGCGQFHAGLEAPSRCPVCGRNQGYFIRSSFYPFSG
ncbi:MAG: ferritin family protein [Clostridiales bacterium]|nr:ferritin family protein [Clostridiales bacterium]